MGYARYELDDARLAPLVSVADLYFQPSKEEDEAILEELNEQYPEEGGKIMKLIPAWTKWAKEEGMEESKQMIFRKLLDKGFTPEGIADLLEFPLEEVRKETQVLADAPSAQITESASMESERTE